MIEQAIQNGDTLLIENIDESIDAVLDPLLGRVLIKQGKSIKIGDKEIDYNPNFRLILQTKLANPHYKPEMQAQTTLINFTGKSRIFMYLKGCPDITSHFKEEVQLFKINYLFVIFREGEGVKIHNFV